MYMILCVNFHQKWRSSGVKYSLTEAIVLCAFFGVYLRSLPLFSSRTERILFVLSDSSAIHLLLCVMPKPDSQVVMILSSGCVVSIILFGCLLSPISCQSGSVDSTRHVSLSSLVCLLLGDAAIASATFYHVNRSAALHYSKLYKKYRTQFFLQTGQYSFLVVFIIIVFSRINNVRWTNWNWSIHGTCRQACSRKFLHINLHIGNLKVDTSRNRSKILNTDSLERKRFF